MGRRFRRHASIHRRTTRTTLAVAARAACGLGALVAAGVASAQGTNALADCVGIAGDAERLACYDRASGRGGAARVAPPAPAPAQAEPAVAPTPAILPAANERVRSKLPSLLDDAWALDPASEEGVVRFHRENYALLGRWSDNPNQEPDSPRLGRASASPSGVQIKPWESKFQLSVKSRLYATESRRFAVWAAYTQQSSWQVFTPQISRPFRETNYQPELIGTFRPDLEWQGFRWRVLNLALNHQSNGRAEPLSRSWNRVYAEFGIERGNFVMLVRPWIRLSEKAERDDNRDITDYLGHGDLHFIYKWRKQSVSAMVRGNPGTGRGAVQLGWQSAPFAGPLRGYVQVFSGYGESLVDYNWRQTTVGLGVALSDLP